MTPDTKRTIKEAGVTVGIIGAALGVGIYFSDVALTVNPTRQLRLTWTDTNPTNLPGLTAEFWASTNLSTWRLKTNHPVRPGSNFASFPATLEKEFFKLRNRQIAGGVTNYSDWSK